MSNIVKTIVKNIFSFLVCGFLFCIGAAIMAAVVSEAVRTGGSPVVCWGAYLLCCLAGIIWTFSRLFQSGN